MTNAETKEHGFTDAHVHLQDRRFGETWDEVGQYLARAKESGIERFLCVSASPADWNRTAELARRFDSIYPSFGVHPWSCRRIQGDWLGALTMFLDSYVAKDGVTKASLGEVGLDYAVRQCDETLQKEQEELFLAQLQLANDRAIPVTLHSVRANFRILEIMKSFSRVPAWILHSWQATREEIERALDYGAFFSFSNRSVAPRARFSRECVAAVPRDRILLESDGPTLLPPDGYGQQDDSAPRRTTIVAPATMNGERLAEPGSLLRTAEEIARIRKTSTDEFFRQLAINEKRFLANWPKKSESLKIS